jgi:DNA-binding transcriptional LysR family regulator
MLFETAAAAYFPLRIVRPYLADGSLRLVSRARRFVYPVYAAYHEAGSRPTLTDTMLERLRQIAAAA